MVLGVTAAIASADQMRAMALEAEKKGAAKPLIIQNVAKLNEQLQTAEKEAKSFEKLHDACQIKGLQNGIGGTSFPRRRAVCHLHTVIPVMHATHG